MDLTFTNRTAKLFEKLLIIEVVNNMRVHGATQREAIEMIDDQTLQNVYEMSTVDKLGYELPMGVCWYAGSLVTDVVGTLPCGYSYDDIKNRLSRLQLWEEDKIDDESALIASKMPEIVTAVLHSVLGGLTHRSLIFLPVLLIMRAPRISKELFHVVNLIWSAIGKIGMLQVNLRLPLFLLDDAQNIDGATRNAIAHYLIEVLMAKKRITNMEVYSQSYGRSDTDFLADLLCIHNSTLAYRIPLDSGYCYITPVSMEDCVSLITDKVGVKC